MIKWIENWYKSQCNNDWEHNYGIKIITIDNPGWELTIDLEDTNVVLEPSTWKLIGDFDKSWVGYKIEGNKFNGASDPQNLSTIILIFKQLVEEKNIVENDIKKILNNNERI